MQTRREIATLGARILFFLLALGILGGFWLPWVQIDGMKEPSTGVQLMALAVTPTLDYLRSASPISAVSLIGGPLGISLLGLWVVVKYAQRRTAIIPTIAVLVVAVGIPQSASGLLVQGIAGYGIGLQLIIVAGWLLLAHQSLIKVSTALRTRRKFPVLYRTLAVVTGSGYYRWSER